MKRIILLFTAFVVSVSMLAQSRTELYEQFKKSCEDGDTTAIKSIIAQWETAMPNDAEIFSLYANYYLQKARKEIVIVSKDIPEDPDIEYLVAKDSSGHTIYMYSEIDYDKETLSLSLDKLKEGISKFPDRLDLRLGKAAGFGMIDSISAIVDELIEAIDHSKVNNNKWLYTLDEPVEDGEEWFTDIIQHYFLKLFSYEDTVDQGSRLVEHAVKAYPNNIKFLNDIVAVKYTNGDIEGALKDLLTIHEKDPEDMVVVYNIGYIYEKQGDIVNAIKYYKLLIYGNNEDYQKIGKKAVEELSAKLPK